MKNTLLASCYLLFTGCAVYVPTVPSTPLLRAKGEVEVTAAIRGISSLEAGAAWSPTGRLLVVGEAALQTSEGSTTRNNITTNYHNVHQQAGLGFGSYRLLGKEQSIYLGALGGVGLAKAEVYHRNVESIYGIIPALGPLVQYKASYLRYYGQVYIAEQRPGVSYGLSVRSTLVGYINLLRDNMSIQPLNRFFLEPNLFVRVGQGPIQAVATLGLSMPGHANRENPDNEKLAPSSSLISAGIVVRPQLFRHRE